MRVPVLLSVFLVAAAGSGCLQAARDIADFASDVASGECGAASEQLGGLKHPASIDRYPFVVPGPAILTLAAGVNMTTPGLGAVIVTDPSGAEFWRVEGGPGLDPVASERIWTNPPVGEYTMYFEVYGVAQAWFVYAVAGCMEDA